MIVDPYIDEIAISDYVASELGVILIDLKKRLVEADRRPTGDRKALGVDRSVPMC